MSRNPAPRQAGAANVGVTAPDARDIVAFLHGLR
jgi:hypothetical protein